MPGTREGGLKAAKTLKKRYGKDVYEKMGAKGGKNSATGGFYVNRELAKTAGAKGGRISKRKPWTKSQREAHYAKKEFMRYERTI